MKPSLPLLLVSLVLPAFAGPPAASAQDPAPPAAASMQRKLAHIQANGALAHPDPAPTQFTEQEVNSYLASGRARLPAGVQSVRFQGEPGVITSTARVDFDQLKAGRRSSNPLLAIFSGMHDVVVVAHAYGAAGQGLVHVDSVALDGIEIPHFVLQLFVEKYLQPKYPNIGMDSRFVLPDKIETATVGLHKLTMVQK